MSRKVEDLEDLDNVDDIEDMEELDDLDMGDMPSLFWSLTITPGKESPIEDPGDGFLVHITNACFGTSVTKDSRTVVVCKVEEKEVPVCVLREGSYENHQLDLLFSDPASFVIKGNKPSAVTLTGYLQPDTPNIGGGGGPGSLMSDEIDAEEIDAEETDEVDISPALKGKRPRPDEDELLDENDESDSKPARKKPKNNNQNNTQGNKNAKGQQGQKAKQEQTEEKSSNDTPTDNKDKNKMIKMKNGIQYKDMKEGTGSEIKHGQYVNVYYVGQDSSANVFDKQLSGEGFKFQFGKGEVIKGWDLGLKGMKVGGKRKLVIPSKFAYGKDGAQNIKPNEDLTFTVEIKNISSS